METIAYQTMDKSDWPAGPWQDEPDKLQFPDPETGMPCLMVRNRLGNWCGYVGVAEGHPWFERDYDELAVDVHYGLTFAAFCHEDGDEATDICHVPGPGEVARIWWLGFDTSHGGDYPPSYGEKLDAYRSSYGGVDDESKWPACTYKTEAYVRREVATVAAQAVQAAARMPDDA